MTSTETWSRLSAPEQLSQWRSFIDALDAGDAGYHRYHSVLLPLWDRGEVPDVIDEEQLAARDTEMTEEAIWAARHASAFDLEEACHGFGSPPF